MVNETIISYFATKTYVVGAQKNPLVVTVFTHQTSIMFDLRLNE